MADLQVVVFKLGGTAYAVDIRSVREIITPQKITPVPGAGQGDEGILNLRGRVIPVVDLRRHLGLQAEGDEAQNRIVVMEVGSRTVGCIVDAVTEVMTLTTGEIEPADSGTSGPGDWLAGIAKVNGELVLLIDSGRALQRFGQEAAVVR